MLGTLWRVQCQPICSLPFSGFFSGCKTAFRMPGISYRYAWACSGKEEGHFSLCHFLTGFNWYLYKKKKTNAKHLPIFWAILMLFICLSTSLGKVTVSKMQHEIVPHLAGPAQGSFLLWTPLHIGNYTFKFHYSFCKLKKISLSYLS